MKPELKKLLVLNLPYLLFVYLFAKCGQAYRLAAGADASAKLLHLTGGIAVAFANPLPSLHTRRTKLTLQAGTTRTTPSCGARHGLIFQTAILNAPEAQSVSTTEATPKEELTRYPLSTWA